MSVNRERLPSCLGKVNAVVTSTNESNLRIYKIGCTCGSYEQKLLGYTLESQSMPSKTVFVGPLSIECPLCRKRMLFFDSELHGYDGEHNSGVAMCGTGEPQHWICPTCDNSIFEIEVCMTYNVEPDEEYIVRQEDFFSEIAVFCKCTNCSEKFNVTSITCI